MTLKIKIYVFSGKKEKDKQASAIFLYLYICQAEEELDELGGTEGPDRPLQGRTYMQLAFTSWFYLPLQIYFLQILVLKLILV